MVHVSMLLPAFVAGAIIALMLEARMNPKDHRKEDQEKILALECDLSAERAKKNSYRLSYEATCAPDFIARLVKDRTRKMHYLAGEGARRIVRERIRQKAVEGWTSEHDAQHLEGELAVAAACYAVHRVEIDHIPVSVEMASGGDAWPWSKAWDKRNKHNRVRRLEIAGALIAAEIDRLETNPQPTAA